MADIVVKQIDNVEVAYRKVDQILVPTSDGGTAVFRQWNGVTDNRCRVSASNLFYRSTTIAGPTQAPVVSVTLS